MNAHTPEETLSELAELTNRFFRAVSFEEGAAPSYANIHTLFIEQGLLVKNSGPRPEICNLQQFIDPRQASVQAGKLTSFHEAEISHKTELFGNVAHRFSTYVKSGTLNEVRFEARGMISTQFVRTPDGWRVSSMVWDDERQGLSLADHCTSS